MKGSIKTSILKGKGLNLSAEVEIPVPPTSDIRLIIENLEKTYRAVRIEWQADYKIQKVKVTSD